MKAISQEYLQQVATEAVQLAGKWLLAVAAGMIDHQTGLKGPGSLPGNPPFKRTGYGQETLGIEYLHDGVQVGVSPMPGIPGRKKQPDMGTLPGRNYLAGWDLGMEAGHRPWLSTLTTRYRAEIDRIIKAYLDSKLSQ